MSQEKPPSFRSNVEDTYMSDRGIRDYIKNLDIQEKDLYDPEAVILDLGSGIQQDLAKEINKRTPRPKIISIDPRLGLNLEEDLSLMKDDAEKDQQRRVGGRKNPEPLTIAALSQNIPLKDNSVEHVYALYSVPYYLESDIEGIKKTLHEVIRVTKPGGSIRAFPVVEDRLVDIQNVLQKIKGISFTLTEKESKLDNSVDWLLVIRKDPEETKNIS